jgi:hypothetical protein
MTVMLDRWGDARTQASRDVDSSLLGLLTMAAIAIAVYDVVVVATAFL